MKNFLFIIFLPFVIISCNDINKKQGKEVVPYSTIKNENKEELIEWNKRIFEADMNLVKKFIERRQWDMEISETGLFWQIYNKTDGENAAMGKVAEFKYKISLLSGEVLYTSDEYGNRELYLGRNQEEAGVNEGICKMKVGEKARFILLPHLAFGVAGDGNKIPVYSTLVYEIELISLKTPTI
jgi:FKBP-type peptidyl-prolyl cis-trans isomerase